MVPRQKRHCRTSAPQPGHKRSAEKWKKPLGKALDDLLAPLCLVGRLDQALHQPREGLDAVIDLAVAAGGVAGVDALEDDRQLPVAEGDEEVEVGEVAAGALCVALPQLLPAGEARR